MASQRGVCAALVVTAAGTVASLAAAQDANFLPASGEWNDSANWDIGAVPTSANNAYVYGGRQARMTANYIAQANQLMLGYNSSGYLNQQRGQLQVSNYLEVGGVSAGGTGLYELYNDASMTAYRVMIGRNANSTLNMTPGFTGFIQTSDDLYVGGSAQGTLRQQGGIASVQRDVVLGYYAGGSGLFDMSGGVAFSVRDTYIGWDGRGALNVANAGTNYGVGGTMYVGRHGSAAPLWGDVHVSNSGRLYSYYTNAPGQVIVQGSNARMYGEGTYDVKVRFESDRAFGNVNKSVAVDFNSGILTRSSMFNVGNGLNARSGPAPAQTALTSRALPGTNVRVSWGDATFAQSANYNNVAATPANFMGVTVPYNSADIVAGGGVTANNLMSRIRLMQVGARRWNAANTEQSSTTGQIRNITTTINADTVAGKTQDVFGEWNALIVGKAVAPQHQDPAFRALQADGLNGDGVVMGQIEPGLPDQAHGAFENWAAFNTSRLSYSGAAPAAGASSAHATKVASIMVGYDPLALQVDGQGRLVAPGDEYGRAGNTESGFTGIAPRARLVSRNWTDAAGVTTDITTIASVANMKVVNMSAGYSQSNGANPKPTGDNPEERAIDRVVENNSIVWVKSAGNDGTMFGGSQNLSMPAGTYNGIVVGAVEFDRVAATPDGQTHPTHFDVAHAIVANFSSRGPTDPDSSGNTRSKPDLVAQGVGNLAAYSYDRLAGNSFIRDATYGESQGRGLYSTSQRYSDTSTWTSIGTSFAAPTVAGTAALMVQKARQMGLPPAEDPRVIKSILQTTADKPANWEKGKADAGADDSTRIPLSYDWGAGLLDPVGAVSLLSAGIAPNPRYITDSGWYFTNMQNADRTGFNGRFDNGTVGNLTGDAFLLTDVLDDTSLTITLNWYSHVTGANVRNTLTQMFMQLYTLDAGVWEPIPGMEFRSDSTSDNLQHIFVNQMPVGGNVLCRVFLNGNIPVANAPAEGYGISWEYQSVPAPAALVLISFGSLLARRRRRA